MKATGIIRKIDDLGRVVIPKELRNTLRLRVGDPVEIFTDRGGQVIFHKYSPMGELRTTADLIGKTLHDSIRRSVVICDRDCILSAHGKHGTEIANADMTRNYVEAVSGQSVYRFVGGNGIYLVAGNPDTAVLVSVPIMVAGDVMGYVVCISDNIAYENVQKPITDADINLMKLVAGFLAKQMEA